MARISANGGSKSRAKKRAATPLSWPEESLIIASIPVDAGADFHAASTFNLKTPGGGFAQQGEGGAKETIFPKSAWHGNNQLGNDQLTQSNFCNGNTKTALQLPIIDLSSQDRTSTALSIRQACLDYGFFYLVNHGVEDALLERVFDESRKFFSLPIEEKMKLARKEHRGYTALYAEKLDPTASTDIGDAKESYYIGPLAGNGTQNDLNQWPSRERLPSWRATMESFYKQALLAGRQVISLIALALNLDENFFEKIGALDNPSAFLRLLHYPGDLRSLDEEILGASAHSDYGMITLLITNGIPGLQVCKEKSDHPRVWEDVAPIDKAFVVNVGDLMERWTNCLFRSTLHRVIPVGEERYSVAFFLDPNEDFVVECLPSCCSESSPPRYPPIRSLDYLKERLRLTYEDGFA